ncbi:leucine-rich repeat domain-containing protein [Fluviicola sp.]|jgi:Leucine-rich repeat (LRR) protein|uniref:leucine-rich repeat domain-containing protein n=1 Tax=Fluviicola sp. TaxID=1917219 RepID=UPI00281F9A05|nr:leucine-rich repeat domain-containing protein [Fluviicola sp.]MDR0802477.1 leucine-rich repeat domain-containing protein [Fluviicola sp.]
MKWKNWSLVTVTGLLVSCSVITATHTDGREITMNYKHLQDIPFDLFLDTTITKMSFFGNKITDIDGDISRLQNLEVLYLGRNKMKSFPKSICTLKNLKVLSLAYNDIDSIPDCICRLKNLERLFISNNKLVYIPDSLGSLRKLEQLDLNRNSIRELPEDLGFLSEMKFLDLSYNNLRKLPDSMQYMSGLKELNLQYSGAMLQIPESACTLRMLEKIKADPSVVFPICFLSQQTNRLVIYIEP